MNTFLKLVNVGNSKGVRLPSRLLKRYGFSDGIEVRETADGLLLLSPAKPQGPQQLSWEETFIEMGKEENKAETRAILKEWECTLNDGLENDPW